MTSSIPITPGIQTYRNSRAAQDVEPYGDVRTLVMSQAGFEAAYAEIRQWPGYAPTPMVELPRLAQELGLARLSYKDESKRFALKSFKALGGAYAVFRLIQQLVAQHTGHVPTASEILSGKHRDLVSTLTVTCATDGNHGRSVAWGAQTFGCRCVIYVHALVSESRADAIAQFGAEVIRIAGNYDDSVRHAAEQAQVNGWTVVSDTTYEGYRDIPIDVMHGYGVMAQEVVSVMGDEPPTHVIVQAGVGAFAAAICAVFWLAWGRQRPRFVVVEPQKAACLFESARADHPVAIQGDLDTVMAGLACGEVSPVAWEILRAGVNDFTKIDDQFALDAMKRLAKPVGQDRAIVSGETGAAGLGLLLAANQSADLRRSLGLDRGAHVLLLGSEGDTDPAIYRDVVGKTAQEVLALSH
ncbi:MAG: diaminopropionate ammonia-lyase [Burkholderiaceae bacterium]|nr:diaminopropionate ammonia-lyase [Burkholderiaceae bacterium]